LVSFREDPLEAKIEKDFVDWVRKQPYPSIALKLLLFGQGGWPDRTIMCKGQIFFIEFKRPGRTLDPAQVKWRKNIERLGFDYFVCTSTGDAIEAFRESIIR